MRFSSFVVCSLTVFLAGGLTAQANETPSSEGSAQEPVISTNRVTKPTVNSRSIEPIVTSETLKEQRFLHASSRNSGQESRLELSTSGQHSLGTAEGQVEALEDATLKTIGANISEDQALPRNLDAKPPALSEESLNKNSSSSPPQNLRMEGGAGIFQAEALRPNESVAQSLTNNTRQMIAQAAPEAGDTCVTQRTETPDSVGSSATYQLAQNFAAPSRCSRPQPIPRLAVPEVYEEYGASPALSIYIPVGYGADRNTVFLNGNYQASVREDEGSVGAAAIGIGVGDADKAAGLELSYALETTDDEFGEGGFNAKLHRRLGQDLSAALGWNGFLNIGRNDFEQSKYGVITKVFRTQESLNSLFSRVALTVGVGDGQFRSNGAVDAGDNNINVFGNVAVRVARPVSFIAEWTGQDLALGLSIAPFKNIPFVITPAVRDIAGAGDEAQFVIGAGTALRF